MPLPMVHLAVAVHMHRLEGSTPSPDFLLGSIAPDAIHMRPNVGPDDKRRVHLAETHDPHHERVRPLLAEYRSDESTVLGFAEGYAAHVLIDYLWVETVIDSFRRSIPPGLSDREERSLYYLETDQIDFCLYHRMPWRLEVWSKLAVAQPRDFCPLLTAEEIRQWRDRTLAWFEELKEEPMIEPVYITYADVEAFIDQATRETRRVFAAFNLKQDAGER